jgi:two-component system chemotaxis sensor kinase CheA
LYSAVQETDALVGLSRDLQKSLEPFTYIAIQMRLEGARLAPEDKAAISTFHTDMSGVLSSLTVTRESQRTTLLAVRDKFSAARQSVERVSASFAVRATESENRIRVDSAKLDALMRLAGELLVARGALPGLALRIERGDSAETIAKEIRVEGAKASRLANELQATVMSMRMLPARQVFRHNQRM